MSLTAEEAKLVPWRKTWCNTGSTAIDQYPTHELETKIALRSCNFRCKGNKDSSSARPWCKPLLSYWFKVLHLTTVRLFWNLSSDASLDSIFSPYRAAPEIFRAHVFTHVEGSRNIQGFRTSLFYWRRSSEFVGLVWVYARGPTQRHKLSIRQSC